MIKYLIGALLGGIFGYYVLYRLVGCSSGACPITASPYASILLGVALGALLAGAIPPLGGAPLNKAPQPSAPAYRKITAEQAKARMDSGDALILLDVRTEAEFRAEHIPGAILLPNETIASARPAELPDLDAEILIYCRSGNRSAQAARKLLALGYTNVSDFGGIIEWPYETVTE